MKQDYMLLKWLLAEYPLTLYILVINRRQIHLSRVQGQWTGLKIDWRLNRIPNGCMQPTIFAVDIETPNKDLCLQENTP